MNVNWAGVFPAVTTKFADDGKLDIGAMERHFSFLIEACLPAIFTKTHYIRL